MRSDGTHPRRSSPVLLALIGLALAGAPGCRRSRPAEVAPAPPPAAERVDRVLIVSVDGMGSEVLRQCPAPNLAAQMSRGAFTLGARTTETAKTLPSHVSMLTGVAPEKHGVDWNDAFRGYPKLPTLMEVAKRHRPALTTALVAGKAKFKTFTREGALDWSFVPEADDAVTDAELGQRTRELIREHRPHVLVLHLPGVDRAGHAKGWSSPEQCQALAQADQAVGQVLEALQAAGLLEQTVLFATADHGGFGRSHQPDDGKSMSVPWIVAGPGVRAGLDLASVAGLQVRVEDTFATACWLLGLPLEAGIDGRPVSQVAAAPRG